MDEFDFMSGKVVKAMIATCELLEALPDQKFKAGGITALEEFYFRMCGKHFDWYDVRARLERGEGESK